MKIGIFSCSSSCKSYPNRNENAIKFLKSKGHILVIGSLFNKGDFNYRSGTIEERINEFNNLLKEKCDIYLSSIGGYCANSITPFINYKAINKNMTFVGCSDATAVLINIAEKTKAKVIYGPSFVSHFGEWENCYSEQSYEQLMKAILNKNVIKKFKFWTDDYKNWNIFESEKNKYKNKINFIGKGLLSGYLYPINLSSFSTAYNKKIKLISRKNTILFIEDSHKDVEFIEKLLSFLVVNNLFKNVKCIILGKYEKFNDKGTNKKPHNVLIEVLKNNKIDIKKLCLLYWLWPHSSN